MNMKEILRESCVLADLKGGTKKEILTELTASLKEAGFVADAEEAVSVILEREKLGSTGIGDGIAIPHGKLAGLDEMMIAFGRSREGIGFEAMDGKPVHLISLLIAPENSAGLHLKALAKISRMMKDERYRRALLEAKTHGDLVRIITEKDDET